MTSVDKLPAFRVTVALSVFRGSAYRYKMKGVIAFVLGLSFASCAVLKFDEYKQQWEAWKTFHGKQYKTDTEEGARYAIWRDNLRVSKR